MAMHFLPQMRMSCRQEGSVARAQTTDRCCTSVFLVRDLAKDAITCPTVPPRKEPK